MSRLRFAATVFALLVAMGASANAASLRVSPVNVSVTAPDVASSIRVWNDGDTPINIQVRVFRWTQDTGEDLLVPTTDVAVSPPIAALPPGGETLVRIIRTAQEPPASEEAYRLYVDELPNPGAAADVALVVRHSIPVFFVPAATGRAQLDIGIEAAPGGYVLVAANSGSAHIRIANVKLLDDAGAAIGEAPGLVGYVLPGATRRWAIRGTPLPPGTPLAVQADTNSGPFDATVSIGPN